MEHCGTQRLETDRLILRRFTLDDAGAMFRNWVSDKEVTKYLTWPVHTSEEVTLQTLKGWVPCYEKSDYYLWAIVLRENGEEPIGIIAVVELDDNTSKMQIGYCLGRKWWHMGIMSESLKAVTDYLFEAVGVGRIEAVHDPRNVNSGRVMKKCGMTYEGTLRRADRNNQGICDACYWSVLIDEWQEREGTELTMIVLITGASHTGKTVLAQKLLEMYKYPYLSIDHLKMGLIRSGQTDLTPYDDEKLTVYLWSIVKEIVKTAVENGQDLIIEGCYIPFDWKDSFDESYLSHIRYICLVMSERYIEEHFGDIIAHENDIEHRQADPDFTAGSVKRENRYFLENCKAHGLNYVLADESYDIDSWCKI